MATPTTIQGARRFLSNDYSYIGALLWALRPVEVPGLGTMGVDAQWHLYYDPDLDTKWKPAEVLGVLFHEINHLLRNHTNEGRAKPFLHCSPYQKTCTLCQATARRFNLCADLEINPGLLKLGFELPLTGVFPHQYGLDDGLLAEQYWSLLPKGAENEKGNFAANRPGVGSGECGSCAGNASPHEVENASGDESGAQKDLSDAERDLIVRDVAKKIGDAVSQQRGNVPAGLELWAHDYLHPKVPWRRELRSATHRNLNECAGKREYSFRRPHRRQGLSKTILPTTRDFFPRIGVVRDTSGSMGDKDLQRSLAETRGILSEMGGEVVDIEVDCKVHAVKTIKSVKALVLQGGGGTDMRVGIGHAATLRPRLDIVVVITDGETPWPLHKPAIPCIVVLTRSGAEGAVPTWAKTILIND